jgi:hypothetical protein
MGTLELSISRKERRPGPSMDFRPTLSKSIIDKRAVLPIGINPVWTPKGWIYCDLVLDCGWGACVITFSGSRGKPRAMARILRLRFAGKYLLVSSSKCARDNTFCHEAHSLF